MAIRKTNKTSASIHTAPKTAASHARKRPVSHCRAAITPSCMAPEPGRPTADELAGMDWWNGLDEAGRRHWMEAAGNTGRASDAWDAYKRTEREPSSETFFLNVVGDSMEPDFREGDVIVVDPLRKPRPGSFVVALTNSSGTAMFKQYRDLGIDERGNRVFELLSLNEFYPSWRSDRETIGIIGTVIQHQRNFK